MTRLCVLSIKLFLFTDSETPLAITMNTNVISVLTAENHQQHTYQLAFCLQSSPSLQRLFKIGIRWPEKITSCGTGKRESLTNNFRPQGGGRQRSCGWRQENMMKSLGVDVLIRRGAKLFFRQYKK